MFQEDLAAVYHKINSLLPLYSPLIISIDGVGDTGKTTLANLIIEKFGGEHIEVDNYLTEGKGKYIPFIQYKSLKKDFLYAQARHPTLLIIEGLCILAILKKLKIGSHLSVYIKQIDKDGSWEDERICDENNDLAETVAYIGKYESLPGIGDADRERARYHFNFHPISNASLVLHRIRK